MAEEDDLDDPFAMMSGMGGEDVYQVTLVEEAGKTEVAEKASALDAFLQQVEHHLLDIESALPLPSYPSCPEIVPFEADAAALLRLLQFARGGELSALLADAWLEPVAAALARESVTAAMQGGGLARVRSEVYRACGSFAAAAPAGGADVRGLGLLLVAVASLQLYMRANWTGPPPEDVGPFSISDAWPPSVADKEILAALEVDGEPAYELLQGPGYLWLAACLLGALPSAAGSGGAAAGRTLPIWRSRAAFAWQLSLAEASERGFGQSPRLFELSVLALVGSEWRPGALAGAGLLAGATLESARAATVNVLKNWTDSGAEEKLEPEAGAAAAAFAIAAAPDNVRAALIVELALRLCWYGKQKPFQDVIETACAAISIRFEVTGIFGIKREYQTVEFAQLMCRVESTIAAKETTTVAASAAGGGAAPSAATAGDSKAPETLSLQSIDPMNCVLEKPKVSATLDAAEREKLERPLTSAEQVILLAQCSFLWVSGNPNDEMLLQEVNALAQRVVQTEKAPVEGGEADGVLLTANWLSFSAGLWYRCKAEHHRNKTRERACFQLQSLVDQFTDEKPSPAHRLLLAHCAGYPARFHFQREMGSRMMKMGMVSTAHEQFKKLRMWPEAVDCLMVAERNVEAKEMVKELIAQAPTPRLWCCLGDLEKEPKHFLMAWEISNKRFARAQRSLGRHHFSKGELEKAIEAYKLALNINPLHADIWFSKGVAEMRLKRWDDATVTFNRCLGVDDESSETWGNLAAVHSANGNLLEARSAMSEATRRSQNSYKMWESYMGICMQLRDIQGVIHSMRRLVDLDRASSIQERIVGALTMAVVTDADGLYDSRTGKAFGKQLNEFFKFLTSKVSSAPFAWRFFAELQESRGERQEALDSRMKQHRAAQARIWDERDPDRFRAMLEDVLDCFEVICDTLMEPAFGATAKEHMQPFAYSVHDTARQLNAKIDTGLGAPDEWKKALEKMTGIAEKLDARIGESAA